MDKVIVCHCEDVTLDELYSAVRQGFTDIESLKRYTGIGTGKCQGKHCLVQTIRVLASEEGLDAVVDGLGAGPGESPPLSREELRRQARVPTIRQPVTPLKIDDIVAAGEDEV